jgi:hypothetical protein
MMKPEVTDFWTIMCTLQGDTIRLLVLETSTAVLQLRKSENI